MCVKLLFDQNLSYKLVARLEHIYPDSIHIAALGMDQASDKKLWEYAKEHGFVIVSKDADFNEITAYYNFPPYIIWLRLGNSRISVIENALTKHHEKICEIIEEAQTGIIEIKA